MTVKFDPPGGRYEHRLWRRQPLIAVLLLLTICSEARGATLQVGAGRRYAVLSEALLHAHNGDRIVLAAGIYRDCAVIRLDDLTIEGTGSNTVITGPVCQQKALLIVTGSRVTLRNLSLTHAHTAEGNAAGIRLDGADLTVEHLRLIDNQNGILTAASPESSPRSALIVRDSEFLQNGACLNLDHGGACAHGIYAGHIGLLRVERSRFFETHSGHHIKSRAARTEVLNCDLQDGARGTSSYQIELPNGGALLARGNVIEKGPLSENREAAISIGAEGVTMDTPQLIVRNNNFAVFANYESVLVRNLSQTPVMLSGNRLRGVIQPLQGPGRLE